MVTWEAYGMHAQLSDGMHGGEQGAMVVNGHQPTPKSAQPKALRFVTNYGAPHPKRRRIGAACLTCTFSFGRWNPTCSVTRSTDEAIGRKRKTACSGERPTCETCRQNKLDCAGYSEGQTPGRQRTKSDASERRFSESHERDDKQRKTPTHQFEKSERNSDPGPNGYDQTGMMQTQNHWATAHTNGDSSAPNTAGTVERGRQPGNMPAPNELWQESLFAGPRNRMPYFRWLGPTAIMPGFKQMVVKVKRQGSDLARSESGAGAGGYSPSVNNLNPNTGDQRLNTIYSTTPAAVESDSRTPLSLPFYDNSPMPPSELITHLAYTFFTHLGCNYPFLQKERFLRDLEEKQVDAILVDAVCALAARFSTHTLLTHQYSDESKTTPAEYGHVFAQRAKTALVDAFPCPSVAVVQAALLLAYNEFGESRDSGLWMYLGISIRMAQDLGLHKVEGLKYKGKTGPTPKMVKRESMSGSPELPTKLTSSKKAKDEELERNAARDKVVKENMQGAVDASDYADGEKEVAEQKSVEQERVDTFWAVFFLDRVVSSGTGRRSTLRDKDIELSFPALDMKDPKSGWPVTFPALIRIVHLYGRVADLLNSIKEPSDITSETPKRMASMESQVTNFYQGLSPRLHFDAVNFQHYMKAGEGTNFVLLHFWFHTLIVLLHQPTLLKTFEGRMLQLFPNSQQLSMSSAKTIADILSYSQLMDAKASLGNPFTSQPIYIAACAFLKETAERTAESKECSRASSPSRKGSKGDISEDRPPSSKTGTPTKNKRMSISELSNHQEPPATPMEQGSDGSLTVELHKSSEKSAGSALSAAKTASSLAKHTLLATAASQHYQLCYKALESLEFYWSGAKYILTVLDQKFEGIRDPLLYTTEEGESAMEQPRPEPSFTSPGWRRKLSSDPYLYNSQLDMQNTEFWKEKAGAMHAGSPDPSKGESILGKHCQRPTTNTISSTALGWTLTGTMNSPSTHLAWHYPSETSPGTQIPHQQHQGQGQAPNMPQNYHGMTSGPEMNAPAQSMHLPPHLRTASTSGQARPPLMSYPTSGSTVSNPDHDMFALSSPYQGSNPPATSGAPYGMPPPTSNHDMNGTNQQQPYTPGGTANPGSFGNWNYNAMWNHDQSIQPFGDMMIEHQDVDTSMLGLDMMPWFDSYPAHEYANIFSPGAQNGAGNPNGGAAGTPQG